MKEFKIGRRYFINSILAIVLGLILGTILKSSLVMIIIIGMTLVTVYDFVNKAFLTYVVDDKSLIERRLTKEITLLYWEDVKTIARLAHVKDSVGIFTDNKKFIINHMIKDYKEMVRLISEKCSNNPSISIDPKVYDQ